MNSEENFYQDRATEEEIRSHLVMCDAGFVPPLSSRVAIGEYAHKIHTKALRFEAWANGSLRGLVAVYCDPNSGGVAHVSSVSVLPDAEGFGIASRLLDISIGHLWRAGCKRVELEVHGQNRRALSIYERLGFVAVNPGDHTIRMRLEI